MPHLPSDSILTQAEKAWGLTTPCILHRRVENAIYFTAIGGTQYVLRLTEPTRRHSEDLLSELHWQRWLAENGAHCTQPALSVGGRLVEELKHGDELWLSCLFSFAPGKAVSQPHEFTAELMTAWGETLAQLHQLSTHYTAPATISRRRDWRQDFETSFGETLSRCDDNQVQKEAYKMIEWLDSLSKANTEYGLVHTDLHHGNFFWDGSRITTFDYDDCCYHWFMYDLAVPIFYLRLYNGTENMGLDLKNLESIYLQSYFSARPTDEFWVQTIERFIGYRGLIMRLWSQMQLDDKKLSEPVLKWCQDYINWWSRVVLG